MRMLAVTAVCIAVLAAATPLPAQRRDCRPTRLPEQLPTASALVDSAGAIADVATFVHGNRTMVFSLIFHADDSLPSVKPMDMSDALPALALMHALKPQPPSETWAIRVRVVEGRGSMLTLERSVYCPPAPDSLRPILVDNVTAVDIMKADRAPSQNLGIDAIEVLVSDEGKVLVVRLTGSTGVRAADDGIVHDFTLRHFAPALLDGQPMQAVWRMDGKSPRL